MLKNYSKSKIRKLVRKSQKGDKDAFGTLYDIHLKPIFRFVYFKINSREEAEDLTVQIFSKAWEYLDKYKSNKSSFTSWLYTIARNQVIDYYRTNKREIGLEDWLKETHVAPKMMDSIDNEFLQKELLKKIKKLSEDQQQVIILKFFENFSNKEISQIMNKKEGTIRIMQHRALKNLKLIIDENEI